jgi:hypothetical protein
MQQSKAKITNPRSTLSNFAARGGGVSRDDAVRQAEEEIEAQGDEAAAEINAHLAAIAEILKGVTGGHIAGEPLKTLTARADTIVTIAGTFGLAHLEEAAKSLCHVVAQAEQLSALRIEPIRAHVDAMRLFAHARMADADAETLLAQLAKTVRRA